MCRKTVLGPTFTDDIHEIKLIPSFGENSYLAFSSSERVVGVLKLPLDGNPYRSMGLLAHPGSISNIAPTCNGTFLLSAGGTDSTVHMWLLNPAAIESQMKFAGDGLQPFLNILDDSGQGDKGPAYRELEDYFYYAQLKRYVFK